MALAFLDFLQDWDILTLILAAAVLTIVVLVASFFIAVAWRRWKEGKRRRAHAAKGLAPAEPPPRTGTRVAPRAIITKLPKPRLAAPKLAKPRLALPKLGRKKES